MKGLLQKMKTYQFGRQSLEQFDIQLGKPENSYKPMSTAVMLYYCYEIVIFSVDFSTTATKLNQNLTINGGGRGLHSLARALAS